MADTDLRVAGGGVAKWHRRLLNDLIESDPAARRFYQAKP
jgi:hypothetical protein